MIKREYRHHQNCLKADNRCFWLGYARFVVGCVAVVVVGLLAATGNLTKIMEVLGEVFDDIMTSLQPVIDELMSLLSEALQPLMDLLMPLIKLALIPLQI